MRAGRFGQGLATLALAGALGGALGLVAGWGLGFLPLLGRFGEVVGAAGTEGTVGVLLFGPYAIVAMLAGVLGGLALSPVLLRDPAPDRTERALRAGALAAPVAFLAGPHALVAAPIAAVAVLGSYRPAARPRGRGWLRAAIVPTLCLAGLLVWHVASRLPSDEAELVPLLGANDAETRDAATEALLETSGAAGLARALADPDPSVREEAVLAAQRRPRTEVEALLRGAVDDPNERVRNAARGALFHFGVEEPLAEALHDPSASTRSSMCTRVSYCGDASHVALLEPLLDDPDEQVRACAERTIAHLRGKARPHAR